MGKPEYSSKTWMIADQNEFAGISGDYNPIHIDPVYARRSLFGKAVVHGVHLVLWAMDQYCAQTQKKLRLEKLKVVFRKPLGINEKAGLSIKDPMNRIEVSINHQGLVLTDISLEYASNESLPGSFHDLQQTFDAQDPNDLNFQELPDKKGELDIKADLNRLKRLFPSLCQFVPAEQVAFLITTTRLVGMQCPGRYSVYNELAADFTKQVQGQEKLHYEVKNFNEVFRLASIQVTSSVASAVIKAFVRPQLSEQNKAKDIKRHIVAGEFKGQKALIIGGSRGLGALAAKILALGGAEIYITFAKGQKEALEIKQELEDSGCLIHIGEFDILNEKKNITDILPAGWAPTHLYYFATPFIFEGAKKHFSQDLFNSFCKFYVSGFWKVATQALSLQGLKFIMYPSSSALNELPGNMLEYVAAKSAGEEVASYIQKNYPNVKVISPRLERLATDQTVSLMPVVNKDPLLVLLTLLRDG